MYKDEDHMNNNYRVPDVFMEREELQIFLEARKL